MAELGYYGKGNWGLPELGITELFGGKEQSLSDATVRRITGEDEVSMSMDPTTSSIINRGPTPTPEATTPGIDYTNMTIDPALREALDTGEQVTTGTDDQGRRTFIDPISGEERTKKTPEGYEEMLEEQRRREEELLRQRREQIRGTYGPIITELDRQIGLAPQRRQEQIGGIEQLAGLQEEQAGQIAEQNIGELRSGQKEALRDLSADIRNQMQAAGRLIGNIGAGSSSATQLATEAITRSGQQRRGDVISDVGERIQNVRRLASQQLNKIGQWKAGRMADLADSYTSRINELNMMKAQASSQEQRDIQDAQLRLEQDFINRVRQLDSSALEYSQTVDLWQRQRQAGLEDYASKLAMEAQYGGTSKAGANYQLKTDDKGNTYLFDPDTGEITSTGVLFEKDPSLEDMFGKMLINQMQTEDSPNIKLGPAEISWGS